jgi:hypothetical protein
MRYPCRRVQARPMLMKYVHLYLTLLVVFLRVKLQICLSLEGKNIWVQIAKESMRT